MGDLLPAAHAAATTFMCGLIWFVQVVHYPLFAAVGRTGFAEFERRHTVLTTFIVAPVMLVELVSAVSLSWLGVSTTPDWIPWIGLALLAMIWVSTFLLQVPYHRRLEHGFDDAVHRRLVASNWFRTLAWTARVPIAFVMLGTA